MFNSTFMSGANINPETGIRYGIIACDNLKPWFWDDVYANGKDLHWEQALKDLAEEVKNGVQEDADEGVIDGADFDEEYEERLERRKEELSNNWHDDEPVFEIDMDGVKGQTTWIGGASHLFVFQSDFTTKCDLCSPCVPNTVNLDTEEREDGYEGYDVPPSWRRGQDD